MFERTGSGRLRHRRMVVVAVFVGGCAGVASRPSAPSARRPSRPFASVGAAAIPQPPALRITVIARGRIPVFDHSATLSRNANNYTDGKQSISVDSVSHIRELLSASEKCYRLDPADLGITPESVRAHHEDILRAAGFDPGEPAPPRVEDAVRYERVVSYLAGNAHGVGDHFTRVEVSLDGLHGFNVSSVSSGPLKLPWYVMMGGRSWWTYSTDVARAVAALLPDRGDQELVEMSPRYWPEGFWHDPLRWRWLVLLVEHERQDTKPGPSSMP